MRIALVIATCNRSAVLCETLRAVAVQTRSPDGIFVVDNASSDDTLARVARDFPAVEVLKAWENLGVNGGLALGMRAAVERGFDAFWLMDDDTKPPADALAELERACEALPGAAMIGYQGGTIRWGWMRHLKTPEAVRMRPLLAPGVRDVDFALVDGALIRRAAVDAVGYPPEGYFMMIGDIEYPYRMRRAGLRIGVFEVDQLRRATLGGCPAGSGKPPWRAYYKARNQVRMAIEHRSALLLAGALLRVIRLGLSHTLHGERARALALLRGAADGFRGRMGRTVEPSA